MTDADKAREPGFYWVRSGIDNGMVVAWWLGGMWWLPGRERYETSTEFAEIDERRITREPSEDEMRARLR